MKYLGSKRRIAKHILPIILRDRNDAPYVEPFVGGANSFERVTDGVRIGADTNKYLISLYTALQRGWTPPENISEDEYQAIKTNPQLYSEPLVTFVALCCSFSGKWFGGYARDKTLRNYASEGKRNLLKQVPKLQGATFIHSSYDQLAIPDGSIVYCDPPYQNSTEYKDTFDHAAFWLWAETLSKRCRVFVSEYQAPEGWQSVWSKEIKAHLDNRVTAQVRTEQLFVFKG